MSHWIAIAALHMSPIAAMADIRRDHPRPSHPKEGTAKHLPFWACFGGSFTSQHVPARPKSAPASKADLRSVDINSDESWRIGSQVPEPAHIQPVVAQLPFSNSGTPTSASNAPQNGGMHQVGAICYCHLLPAGARPVFWVLLSLFGFICILKLLRAANALP